MLQSRWSRTPIRLALVLVPIVILLSTLLVNPNWTDRSVHKVLRFNPTHLNLSIPDTQRELCQRYNWKPFHSDIHRSPRKVYDLFMISNELEWLEIRLNTTYNQVDYFVIVESAKTFTNHDKPLTIKENLHKFAAYRDKIIYHQLEIPDGFHSDRPNPAWAWEDLQRNAMFDQVLVRLKGKQAPALGDVIVVADVDEIPRPETLAILKACEFPSRLNIRSDFFYYSFQLRHKGLQWAHPQATTYHGSKTILPVNLRNGDGGIQALIKMDTADLWNAGWHCSSCFASMDELLTKLSSFSHQWMNAEKFRDKERIASYIRDGKDLWDRKTEEFDRIEDNQDVPRILLEQPELFTHLLDRDGPNAGFRDYP
jgi:beta-1,4-mannosyl-glycoprotein beta-1,4-N-acetylglucosaminyltransferase